MKKLISLFTVFFFATAYNISGFNKFNSEQKITIIEMKNESTSQVKLKLGSKNIIDVLSNKNIKKEIDIPFISISKNIIDFTQDKFYMPKGALKVITNLGKFGIWKNEDGIMYAQKVGQNFDKKIQEKLELNNTKNLAGIIKVVLLINKQGKPELKLN